MTLQRLIVVIAAGAIILPRSVSSQIRREHNAPLDSTAIAAGLARLDSTARDERQRILIGAAVGAVTGAGLGYELARVAHRALCEGPAQCAEYPRRGIRESMIGGAIVGTLVGAAVGWLTSSTSSQASEARRSRF